MDSQTRISTSKLAQRLNIPTKHMFGMLSDNGYIFRDKDVWVLTELGAQKGGKYQNSKKFGKYISWPNDISFDGASQEEKHSATTLGEEFSIASRRINQILSELGWIKKHLKGWLVTPHGIRVGGEQRESNKSGVPYVLWSKKIISNKSLIDTIKELKGENPDQIPDQNPTEQIENNSPTQSTDTKISKAKTNFREKNLPQLRTADGHYVRSRAEMLIDNWLYTAEIVHAYERRLPIEEEVYCDFYLPNAKVYIEFWGMESDPKYVKRKEQKKRIYSDYGLSLIELNDDDIKNLDDVLPRVLLKHGITTY